MQKRAELRAQAMEYGDWQGIMERWNDGKRNNKDYKFENEN
jgi:hypothetical protein